MRFTRLRRSLSAVLLSIGSLLTSCDTVSIAAPTSPVPVTQPTTQPDYLRGWVDMGGQVAQPISAKPATVPTTKPTTVPATKPVVDTRTPFEKWQAWLPVMPAPTGGTYVPSGTELSTLMKPGVVVVCLPRSAHAHYTFTGTVDIPANSVIDLNGSDLSLTANPGHANLAVGANVIFRHAHITRGDNVFVVLGKNVVIAGCFSDDWQPDPTGTWVGVAGNFLKADQVDTTTNDNVVMRDCGVGATGSVSFYITCNHAITNCSFARSIGEYDYRSETTTGGARCKKGRITHCMFEYGNAFNKGSVYGIRMGDNIEADDCWFRSNAFAGQKNNSFTTDHDAAAAIVFRDCKFMAATGSDLTLLNSQQGCSMLVDHCTFYPGLLTASCIGVAGPNTTNCTNNTVYAPVGAKAKLLGTPFGGAKPTESDTTLIVGPYTIPPFPTPWDK